MPETKRYKQYEILRRPDGTQWELGSGAMGTTYKAFDTNLRVNVALKVINAKYLESEVAQQRFMREARDFLEKEGEIHLGFADSGDNRLVRELIAENGYILQNFQTQLNGDWSAFLYTLSIL